MKSLNLEDKSTGVVIFGEYPEGAPARIEVRSFAPAVGVIEDPVCGSGNGCVAAFIRHTGQTAYFGKEYLASQGAILGRAGVLRLSIREDRIQVGGAAVTCIDGQLSI
jgi:PhzF family phenazine biosynthesis protein